MSFRRALAAALAASSIGGVLGLPCVAFDAGWNLYAFGVQGQYDWAFGTSDSWSSGPNVTNLSKNNAPPMNGNNTQCFLSQFQNAIYVLDGDASNPLNVHIFNAGSQSWSVQQTQGGSGFSITDMTAILDHDTDVFFALVDGGALWQLDMGDETQASSSALQWQSVESPNFRIAGYNPVMAAADNHIYFLNVPGNDPGEADIFVIHFAYFQPAVQTYAPLGDSQSFPVTSGQTASIFQSGTGSQASSPKAFAFFPSDGDAVYYVDVINNQTATLPFPPAPPSAGLSTYAGSTSALVQMTPTGEVYWIELASDISSGSAINSSTPAWAKINNALWSLPSSTKIATATATAKGGNTNPSATTSRSAGAASSSTATKSAAQGLVVGTRHVLSIILGFVGVALL